MQRYFCRVLWLTRNCAYGFAFYGLGIYSDSSKMHWVSDNEKESARFGYEKGTSILVRPWVLKSSAPICKIGNKILRWEVYLGWKIDPNSKGVVKNMIANRIAFRFR